MNEEQSRTDPIAEDMAFQRRSWRVERIGWSVMALVVIAALTGVFYRGPLSDSSVESGDLAVQYERFAHATVRTRFDIRAKPGARNEVQLRLNPPFEDVYDIEAMAPQPTRSSAGPSGLEFTFAARSAEPLAIHIAARPRRSGPHWIVIEMNGGEKVRFFQFIYP